MISDINTLTCLSSTVMNGIQYYEYTHKNQKKYIISKIVGLILSIIITILLHFLTNNIKYQNVQYNYFSISLLIFSFIIKNLIVYLTTEKTWIKVISIIIYAISIIATVSFILHYFLQHYYTYITVIETIIMLSLIISLLIWSNSKLFLTLFTILMGILPILKFIGIFATVTTLMFEIWRFFKNKLNLHHEKKNQQSKKNNDKDEEIKEI